MKPPKPNIVHKKWLMQFIEDMMENRIKVLRWENRREKIMKIEPMERQIYIDKNIY